MCKVSFRGNARFKQSPRSVESSLQKHQLYLSPFPPLISPAAMQLFWLGRNRVVSTQIEDRQKPAQKIRGIATHSVGGLNERIVDGNDGELGLLESVAEQDTTNAAEAVDSDLDRHNGCFVTVIERLIVSLSLVACCS